MKFTKEFKEAISNLPEKEKDRLLFRLLKKDLNLVNRLTFELIDESSVDDHRKIMEQRVLERTKEITNYFYSPGYLMMNMRYLSGEITEHSKITKDYFGEAYLNLLMLVEILKNGNKNIEKAGTVKNRKLGVYIVTRAFKIMILIKKLHSDLFIEFEENLSELGMLIGKNPILMQTAIYHGLDVNWLITGEIPDDVAEIQKDLRTRGYLKA